MGAWIKRLFEEYRFARRFPLFWSMWITTVAVLWALNNSVLVTAPMSNFLIAVLGLVGTITVFYGVHRSGDK
jgi:hypothetical protein